MGPRYGHPMVLHGLCCSARGILLPPVFRGASVPPVAVCSPPQDSAPPPCRTQDRWPGRRAPVARPEGTPSGHFCTHLRALLQPSVGALSPPFGLAAVPQLIWWIEPYPPGT